MLAQRVISAIVLAPLLILTVLVGGPLYLLAVSAAAIIASHEFYLLLKKAGYSPLWPFGMILSVIFVIDPYYAPAQLALPAFAVLLLVSYGYLIVRPAGRGGFGDWSVTWAVPLYTGLLLSYAVALRFLPDGDRWVLLAVGVTWATDIAAYMIGMAVGRRPFFPSISPRKSLEGAAGGAIAGLICAVLLVLAFGWDPIRMLPLAIVAPVAAQAGDLAESMMKRQLNTKDAGSLIPGHGGLLDRMDSVLFVIVVTYFYATWSGA